jgi:hypothetical protein
LICHPSEKEFYRLQRKDEICVALYTAILPAQWGTLFALLMIFNLSRSCLAFNPITRQQKMKTNGKKHDQ